jgi:sporulation protein YlmC with PRC-barrel domain
MTTSRFRLRESKAFRMNKWSLGALIAGVALAFWAPVLRAPQPPKPLDIKPTEREVRLSQLVKADAKTDSGEDLGPVKDVVLDPHTGQLRFLIVGRGGVLGVAQKRVPIPWSAVIIQSENQVALNLSKERLRGAPTVASDYRDLNNPGYLVSLYQYYEVKPTAIGATGESPGGTGNGTGNSRQNEPSFQQ